jgi:hypothetical protein
MRQKKANWKSSLGKPHFLFADDRNQPPRKGHSPKTSSIGFCLPSLRGGQQSLRDQLLGLRVHLCWPSFQAGFVV